MTKKKGAKSVTVIEFKVPRQLAEELGVGFNQRSVVGEAAEMPFVDIQGGSGFERSLTKGQIPAFNKALEEGKITSRRKKLE